jgi:hypothetical protein
MMATKYWLQYHKYDERGEPEGFIINNTKSSCDKARGDLVFLIVGGSFTNEIASQLGIKLPSGRKGLKTYVLWEKFIIETVEYIAERSGYEIRGTQGVVFKPQILLDSPEFYEFRSRYMTTGFKNIGNTAYLPILLNLSGENE